MGSFDMTWHLATTEDEIKVTELELQLWRVFYSFLRWQQACEKNVNGTQLTGQDLAVLHIIRIKDRPKSVIDIARLLNRDDNFNIQYSINKLIKMDLIKKMKVSGKTTCYQMTLTGIKNTDNMALARKKIFVEMLLHDSELNIETTTRMLIRLKTIYEEAEHATASFLVTTEEKLSEDKSI
jgi:predicted MarR family transcription regulator